MLKNSPTPWFSHLQTSLIVCCFWGDVQCAICPPNMVCIMSSKELNFVLIRLDNPLPVFPRQTWNKIRLDSTFLSLRMLHAQSIATQIASQTEVPKQCSNKGASLIVLFSNGVLRGERVYRPWRLSAWLLVFFETIVPAGSRSFWSPPQVVIGSLTTFLMHLFPPLSEI